jgi:hypothetical protein
MTNKDRHLHYTINIKKNTFNCKNKLYYNLNVLYMAYHQKLFSNIDYTILFNEDTKQNYIKVNEKLQTT